MIKSIWRYSHLILAVSSFLFLVVAAITGFILAFQPVIQKQQNYKVGEITELNLAQTLPIIKKNHPGVAKISVDANGFVLMNGADTAGKNISVYISPKTGKILGTYQKESPFFQWVKTLHRSLFLHQTGRFLLGATAFLLSLIAITGILLTIQRQRGIKHFFDKIIKENFAQYYHVVLGRLMLIPILLIALSGTYLSLDRFNVLNSKKKSTTVDIDNIKELPLIEPGQFKLFKETKLIDIESVEFPFSDFPEDYYKIKLRNREIALNQFTGEVLAQSNYPLAATWVEVALDLHTGRTNSIWSIILGIASINILFFIYSGFTITLKRIGNRTKSKFSAAEAHIVLLVGSENGTTNSYAKAIYNQLIKQGEKAHIGTANSYQTYPNAKFLIIFTATYGIGEAPTNASKLLALLHKTPQPQNLRFSVLGFGSKSYPNFCQFAFDIANQLTQQTWAQALLEIHTINDKSPQDFSLWAEAFSQKSGIYITANNITANKPQKLEHFRIVYNNATLVGNDTFLLRLAKPKHQKVKSGDLLAIYPNNDHRERLYSIGMVNGLIQLSVRLHANGLGSTFLHQLPVGKNIGAKIICNDHFHFRHNGKPTVLIANGTGLAPFLGMIAENTKKTACYLYAGFRTRASFQSFADQIEEGLKTKRLSKINLALSREADKLYVSDLLKRDEKLIAQILANGGTLMLCGSLSMQKDVLLVLSNICTAFLDNELSYYQSHDQIMMDCY